MKVSVEGKRVRIFGSRGVNIIVHIEEGKDSDSFSFSVCYDGIESGGLPRIEACGGHVIRSDFGIPTILK